MVQPPVVLGNTSRTSFLVRPYNFADTWRILTSISPAFRRQIAKVVLSVQRSRV